MMKTSSFCDQNEARKTWVILLQSPSSPLPIHHQRTKSNPDRINNMGMSLPVESKYQRLEIEQKRAPLIDWYFTANTAKRLLNAESLNDLSTMKRSKGGVAWSVESPLTSTPPGTPPPPYHGTPQHRKESGTSSGPSPPIPPPPDELDDGSGKKEVRNVVIFVECTNLWW